MHVIEKLNKLIIEKHADIVERTTIYRIADQPTKLRVFFKNNFLDIYISKKKYSYHFQDFLGRSDFRFDNAPTHRAVKTFPHHLHEEKKVKESYLKNNPEKDIEIVFEKIRKILKK